MSQRYTPSLRSLFVLALALCLALPMMAVADDDSAKLGTMLDNASTELRVKTALLDKIGWDMLDVDVEASGSHVTLMGEASSKANSELAREVALSVEGVTDVKNQLVMEEKATETPVGAAVSDAEREVKDALLESRVKTALIAEMGGNAFDIEVEATDGTVSLRGDLESSELQEVALETAESCKGVDKVIDLLSTEG